MNPTIQQFLSPVCRRLRRRELLQAALSGLSYGAAAAILCGLVWQGFPAELLRTMGVVCLVVGPLFAIIGTWRRPLAWNAAARIVDQHYGWQDSVLTAYDFSTKPATTMTDRQMKEALGQLAELRPADAMPRFRLRGLAVATSHLLLAITLLSVPSLAKRPAPRRYLLQPPDAMADSQPPIRFQLVNRDMHGYYLLEPAHESVSNRKLADPDLVATFFERTTEVTAPIPASASRAKRVAPADANAPPQDVP